MTVTPYTMDSDDHGVHEQQRRNLMVFSKMEAIIDEMQRVDTGVPVRVQKSFLTTVPCAFTGYAVTEWLMEKLHVEDTTEALHLATLLCQYGYFFPVTDTKALLVKDDNTLFRFQSPYFWPSQNCGPDHVDYAIYLVKRNSRNKQKHGLEEYEQVALNKLQKMLCDKWDFISMQAEEQVRLAKERKKADKVVLDSQERAFWRVHRPPVGHVRCLEEGVRKNCQPTHLIRRKKQSIEECRREVEFLRRSLRKGRMKISKAAESLIQRCQQYQEHDPTITPPQPSNPWISDDISFWSYSSPEANVLTERQVKRWAFDLDEILRDPKGQAEFETFLQTEFSSENLHFYLACQQLKCTPLDKMDEVVQAIYREYLAPGAPWEINIDGKTMDITMKNIKEPSRFTYDDAKEHIYLLMKKDSYARFVRSERYKQLLASAVTPCPKKKFFNFGGGKKKSPAPTPSPKPKRRGSATNDFQTDCRMTATMSQHSFSTGNLRDLVGPENKSNKSSPYGSSGDVKNESKTSIFPQTLQAKLESLIRPDSANSKNLDVPKYTGRLSLGGNADDGNINLTVPNANVNVVAPWEEA